MTDKNQESSAMDNPLPPEGADQLKPSGASRRRFTKAGLGASGVILTLPARSVLAGGGGNGGGGNSTCKSPSGFLSGNASTHGPEPICQGRSPGYWKTHDGWPIPPDTKFSSIFNCAPSLAYKDFTLGKLIEPQKEDANKLAMHLIAALLNARMGWTPFLTEERIHSMFNEWQADGTFSPSAGVDWDAAQIVLYLTATQG
jgi:hypothetical protein